MKGKCPNQGPWNECVVARTRKDGELQFIGTAKRAATLLAGDWPVKGRAFEAAVAACNDVLKGWSPTYLARIAFEEAVKEAGLRI
jgi:hypothetical protein